MTRRLSLLALFATASVSVSIAQSGVYVDPNRSSQNWRTNMNMNGNNTESIITNYGTIGRGNASINQAGVWPRGTGHGHLHQLTGLVTGRVTKPDNTTQVLLSEGYEEGNVAEYTDPVTGIQRKFQPVPGYFNRSASVGEIANSRNPQSWPDSWPGKDATWNGAWNGFFGLNQFNADQEVFYVMDDTWESKFPVYPVPTDTTIKGLGLQVNVRLFQWSQALAKDLIFMQYEVSNIGEIPYTYNMNNNPMIFGGYTDVNPQGSGGSDDAAAFNRATNIVYGWSATGQGLWSQFREIAPGYIGWKFLESPGISVDGVDNDSDGLVDERRDNAAGNYVFGSCGAYADPQLRWEGDENCNWNPLIDDVGADGIGSLDPNYPGPDADGTEGNGRPDQGEPNFGRLDKNESDQIGLTAFYAPAFNTALSPNNEQNLWPFFQPGFFGVPLQGQNQIWIFASGPFSLIPDQTERFSTAVVFGANSREMFRNAQVAQRIYDADYRFARPPLQPTLTAIPDDGRVILQWNTISEFSYDPIYGFDFEGYRVIKATDPSFRDAKDITDALGTPRYKVSIAQYDKLNGLVGPHPLQLGEEIEAPTGIHYYMGDDTGLRHYYIDDDVINGRVYYYAVIAYDAGYAQDFFARGITTVETGFDITPSESPASITLNNGVITRFDPNTAAVRPNSQPTNIIPGALDPISKLGGLSTGSIQAVAVSPTLFDDASFIISFEDVRTRALVERETSTFTVTKNSGEVIANKVPVPRNLDGSYQRSWTHELIEQGLILQFNNRFPTLSNTQQNSGWTSTSQTNLFTTIDQDVAASTSAYAGKQIQWPLSLEIEVGNPDGPPLDSAFTSTTGNVRRSVWFKVREVGSGRHLDFVFNEPFATRNGVIEADEELQIVYKDAPADSRFQLTWKIRFGRPNDASGNPLPDTQVRIPVTGDKFIMRSDIPFGPNDSFRFDSFAQQGIGDAGTSILDQVRVVPNPYVAANITEGRPFLSGRGERRIEFRNLPANSVLRLYTVSGVFVKQIESGSLGYAVWDLRTKDNLEAAYGLYFYHLEAEGIGEKVGKFAIIN